MGYGEKLSFVFAFGLVGLGWSWVCIFFADAARLPPKDESFGTFADCVTFGLPTVKGVESGRWKFFFIGFHNCRVDGIYCPCFYKDFIGLADGREPFSFFLYVLEIGDILTIHFCNF